MSFGPRHKMRCVLNKADQIDAENLVPLSFILSGVTPYGLDWGLSGIWLGLASSNVVRSLILFNVLRVQDWDAIALKAMEKAREKAPSPRTPRK